MNQRIRTIFTVALATLAITASAGAASASSAQTISDTSIIASTTPVIDDPADWDWM